MFIKEYYYKSAYIRYLTGKWRQTGCTGHPGINAPENKKSSWLVTSI